MNEFPGGEGERKEETIKCLFLTASETSRKGHSKSLAQDPSICVL